MFLNILIICFSWVSFALSAILCANASSPAAEPSWSVECTRWLAIQVCTHHRLLTALHLDHYSSGIFLLFSTCLIPVAFETPYLVPTKRQLLSDPAQDFKGRSCCWNILHLWVANVQSKRELASSPSLHLFLPSKYQVGTAFVGDSINNAPSQTDGKHLPVDSAWDHTGWRGHCKSSCLAQPSHRQRSSTSRGDRCAFFQAEHPQGCGVW